MGHSKSNLVGDFFVLWLGKIFSKWVRIEYFNFCLLLVLHPEHCTERMWQFQSWGLQSTEFSFSEHSEFRSIKHHDRVFNYRSVTQIFLQVCAWSNLAVHRMGWVVWASIKVLYKILNLKSGSESREKWGRNTKIKDTTSQLNDTRATLLLQKCGWKSSTVLRWWGPPDPSESP